MKLSVNDIHRVIERGRIVSPGRMHGELRFYSKRPESVKVKALAFEFGDAFVTYRDNPRVIIDVNVRYKRDPRV